jgi:formate hydrogenlyase subunit 3/multisubunit Na+/H+ antiporter MnhD subunit
LRNSEQLPHILRFSGLIMTVSAGLWAAFQHRLDRILAYGVVAETGCALLSLSLGMTEGIQIIFRLLIPRAFGLAVWALGLSVLKNDTGSLKFTSVQGATRTYPFAVGAVILAQFSMAGLPLLAGFPPRLVLWETLASNSIYSAFWFGIGLLGLFLGAIRSLAALSSSTDFAFWQSKETWRQRILLGLGIATLLLLGLFPQIIQPILLTFPLVFEHLGG